MRVLALEHLRSNPLGLYGELLDERGLEVDVARLDEGDTLPEWRAYDLLVVMGGMSAYEDELYPWLVEEKRTIREAVHAGLPYFGVCLGSQLLAAALGARVYRGAEPELGVNPVFLTEAARRDAVFRGFPPALEVFEWHSDTFDLPEGAVRLARSPRYENQAFRFGRLAYAIQCHLEPSLEDVRDWFAAWPSLVETFERRYGAGSVDRFLDDYADSIPLLRRTARQLFRRWLDNALLWGGAPVQPVRHRVPLGPTGELVGRGAETARIAALLDAARKRRSGALLLRGEPGVGKTALLGDAAAQATGMRVLRTSGAEAKADVPFAGIEELCQPLDRQLERLPRGQTMALSEALGLLGPRRGERFAVSAALVAMLAAAAEQVPLLVLVDDAELLDDESLEAVAFLARRLGAEGIALLLAVGDEETLAARGIEELPIKGLDRPSARALLEARFEDSLADFVAERVLDVARGNALALLEIPRSLTPEQRAGGEPLGDFLATCSSAEQAFLHRILDLPERSRQALVVAALSESDDLDLLERALALLGVAPDALAPAQAAGLVSLGDGKVAFRHPLARSTVAYNALPSERRAAHHALAEVLTGRANEDRHAWHLGRAAEAPDEAVASALEEVARRARRRGAHATAARAYELAAHLTPDEDRHASRLLAAAESSHAAGHVRAALDQLEEARGLGRDEALRVEASHLRGRFEARGGSAKTARDVLVDAAERCPDPVKAGLILADAVIPCLRAEGPLEARTIAARAFELTEGHGGTPEVAAMLMLGTSLLFSGDVTRGAKLVEGACELAETAGGLGDEAQLRAYLGVGLFLAGDDERAREALEALVADARADGRLSILPYALVRLADVELESGRWTTAAAALLEAEGLAVETGQASDYGLALGALAWLHAAQGRDEECRACAREALRLAARLGAGSRLDRVGSALALLELGKGRPAAAVSHLEPIVRERGEQGWSDAAVRPHRAPDLIEALVLAGEAEAARAVLEPFEQGAIRTGMASALAAAAACRGLLAGEDQFDTFFQEALRPAGAFGPFARARTQLRYGQRLLDAGREAEARRELRAALAGFKPLGARPWEEQALHELARSGVADEACAQTPQELLTSEELQVALAFAESGTTEAVAARLFLSPQTVEARLEAASTRIGVRSPAELVSLLRSSPSAGPDA